MGKEGQAHEAVELTSPTSAQVGGGRVWPDGVGGRAGLGNMLASVELAS